MENVSIKITLTDNGLSRGYYHLFFLESLP